nr:hypothetical protein EUX21_03165 [synthetic Caulobacter sp. 'ethensis']
MSLKKPRIRSSASDVVRRRMVGKVSEPRYARFMRQPRGGSASAA